jgi:hypothetical protein
MDINYVNQDFVLHAAEYHQCIGGDEAILYDPEITHFLGKTHLAWENMKDTYHVF